MPRNSYQVAPLIWAGSYIGLPSSDDAPNQIAWLLQKGIHLIIDLTSHDDQLPRYTDALAACAPHITHKQFPMIDGSIPSEVQMVAILKAIDEAVALEHGVYVHCWGGFGRTGMVVACWYKRQEQNGTAALKRIQQARCEIKSSRPSPDYSVQVGFVMRWHEPDFG
jgi:protein tyrosine/serine phosphatase